MTIMWFIMLILLSGSLLCCHRSLIKHFFNVRYGALLIMGVLSLVELFRLFWSGYPNKKLHFFL